MNAELLQLAERFPGRRAVLVGDFMLDAYVFGDAERISPEAPVPVLRVIDRQERVGGAGSVALNLRALGLDVVCCGLIGDDAHGARIRDLLDAAGADTRGLLTVDDRPTITKTRLVGLAEHRHQQQLLRVDDERVAPPGEDDAARLLEVALGALDSADVVCLEDYAKGVVCEPVARRMIDAARAANKPVLVDPAKPTGWAIYRGSTLLTPNRSELEAGVGRRVAHGELNDVAGKLVADLQLDALVVTLGRDGAQLIRNDGSSAHFPTKPRAVYDNTGAGDAVLAAIAAAVAAGGTLEQAVTLANIAGGLEVSKFGCVPIARDELVGELKLGFESSRGKLRSLDELDAELAARRARGETIVFTNGCFDLLHPGHISLLAQAKAEGSCLVVGLNSDASVRAQSKGDDRPIRRQDDRVRMLAALDSVDYIVLFDEASVLPLVERVGPEVLVKGGDYAKHEVVGWEVVERRGGRVALVELVAGHGTTNEIDRIRNGGAERPEEARR